MKNYLLAASILLLLILFVIVLIRMNHKNNYPYTAQYILTRREYKFYQILRQVADEYDCLICPKVGLKDLMRVTNDKEYGKYFSKIAAKHVDFVICDQQLRVLFAIELDDSTHDTKEAQLRDKFKDNAFASAGIPLKRTKNIDFPTVRAMFREEL